MQDLLHKLQSSLHARLLANRNVDNDKDVKQLAINAAIAASPTESSNEYFIQWNFPLLDEGHAAGRRTGKT